MRILRTLGMYIAIGLTLLSGVFAADYRVDMSLLREVFGFFPRFVADPRVAMGATVLLYFMLFYAMFAAGLMRLSFFKKQSGQALNSQGQVAALSISLLSIFGLFFRNNPVEVTRRLLNTNEILAGIIIGSFIFLLFWKGIGSFSDEDEGARWPRALTFASLGLLFAATIINKNEFFGLGFFILFISLIGMIASAAASKRREERESRDYNPEGRREQRREEREEREADNESFADEAINDIAEGIRTSRR